MGICSSWYGEKQRSIITIQRKKPQIDKLRGTKGKDRGMILANFKQGRGDYSGPAGWKNDGAAQLFRC